MVIESERKFLIKSMPIAFKKVIEVMSIQQGYLRVSKDEEVRVRIANVNGRYKCTLTTKIGNGEIRGEVELTIPLTAAESLIKEKPYILKKRFVLEQCDEYEVVVDYLLSPKRLDLLEIEYKDKFPDHVLPQLEAQGFVLEDVTGKPEYSMKNLAKV